MSTQVPQENEGAEVDAGESRPQSPHQDRRLQDKAGKREQAERESEEQAKESEDTVEIKVFRYDPEVEAKQEPRFDTFHVPFEKGMTVLDAVMYARDHYDSSLTFRHSCRQAICGSDAFFINGRQRLGCQTQVAELDTPVRIEPLPHQEVIKDLVVEMESFYEQMEAVEPYFQTNEAPEGDLEEQRQSRENRETIKMGTRCIWCASCMSSCNIAAGDDQYLGPAAISMAYRFAMDDREGEDTATFHGVNGVYNALVNQGLSGTQKTAVKWVLIVASALLIVQGIRTANALAGIPLY